MNMKTLLGIILSIVLLTGGCTSTEDYENKLINAVQTKAEKIWKEDVNYINVTDREWTYHKDKKTGEEYVQMAGIFVYGYSAPIVMKFYIKDGYMVRVVTDSMDKHYDDIIPKSNNSKLDL